MPSGMSTSAGKIVVLAGPQFSFGTILARPQGVTPDDLKGEKGEDWADPLTYARQKGAAGIIVVAPPQLQEPVGADPRLLHARPHLSR